MDQARIRTTDQDISDRRVRGAVTTLGVSYNEKYIGDFLIRREGNSLFGRANRWNTFGRASFAWLLSEEDWFPFQLQQLCCATATASPAEPRLRVSPRQ
jgi:hypothetical protein